MKTFVHMLIGVGYSVASEAYLCNKGSEFFLKKVVMLHSVRGITVDSLGLII